MTRALSSNPGLAFTNSTPIPSGVPLPGQTLTVDGPTKVTGIPFMTIDVPRPDKTEKMVGEWRFTTTRLDRIANQSELDELEKSLAFTAFPEIQFLENTLVVSVASGHRPILNFNLRDILRSAKAYYDGPKYQQEQGDLIIPVSGSWTNSTFAKHDPKIDWAWRNQFFGLGPSLKLAPLKEGSGINWELLKNQKLEIVFFDSFDFFEDDVHDNGMIRCSVKFRVMNEAFFILFRHFVRVDGHELWCRDVRYFHEFTTKRNDQPHIVVVEEVKKLKAIHAIEEVHNTPIDNLLANAETLRKEEFMIEF
ncbi:GAF domain-containing protein [Angomonas deanei]|uniref:TIP41-like family, putative n=1 Tax=Angomonas deanei TaxID=59799 RepID=A0A7G2CLW7_9TRYP|nr:GAF domain-containing protein [Angomonas deanei]CAD2220816.1 TIP41-like family, putative [Angomonas deanei]|eukprot:EPY42040.1 GAF domain-containing protein [Angomonas deanei]